MADEMMLNIADAELATVLDDYDFEGYAVIEKTRQADGRWTVLARKNAANGAEQEPDDDEAVQLDPEPAQEPKPQQPDKAGGRLAIGADGARLIKAFESCAVRTSDGRFRAYRDSVNVLTIGWGHTNHLGRQFDANAVWTELECNDAFASDMQVFEKHVQRLVRTELKQHQFDALVSFCYNCGPGNLAKSTLLKKLNARDFVGAAEEFKKWVKAGGKTLRGLERRRKYESRLFLGHRDMSYP